MAQLQSKTPNGEKLVLHSPPEARVVLFETQPRLTPEAPTIERYTTARSVVFERHMFQDGRVLWYRVQKLATR